MDVSSKDMSVSYILRKIVYYVIPRFNDISHASNELLTSSIEWELHSMNLTWFVSLIVLYIFVFNIIFKKKDF